MVHFPQKKLWVNFFFVKTPNEGGGGVGGGLANHHTFPHFPNNIYLFNGNGYPILYIYKYIIGLLLEFL